MVGSKAGGALVAALAAVTSAGFGGGVAAAPGSPAPGASGRGGRAPIGHVLDLDLVRPRILLRAGDVATARARLDRAPYSTLVQRMQDQIAAAPPPSAADQPECGLTANIAREESKARAAKDLAFMYAVDHEQAVGDLARDYLVTMCRTSRTHIQPDRDINTSNELIQMATAYDTLAGAGYDFGATETPIIDNLVTWTAQFHRDYQPLLNFLTNNHLAKGAASIGTAAIALAGAPGTNPAQLDTWLDFAMKNVEQVVRYTEGSGDGTYGEGPFYWRYTSQNVVPFARAYDAVARGRAWRTRDGSVVRSMWRARWFTDIGRWELDMTRPDGTLVPIDDGNPDDAYYFGALPSTSPNASAYAWRWANAADASDSVPFESNGNVDLAADEIVTYDDAVKPAAPKGSPNRLRGRGGDLVFRSDWSTDAVAAFVQAEHGGARGFGRAPRSPGIPFAAVHDHADPGSFQLDAYGERLLLDPGYVSYSWTLHGTFADPSAHNLVLVGPAADPESPGSANTASTLPSPQLAAFTTDPRAPVPVDGEAFVSKVINRRDLAAATITARYGRDPATVPAPPLTGTDFLEMPSDHSATVERRFVFIDRRYLVIADSIRSTDPRVYSWPLHGNGGGTDGMTDPLPAIGLFQRQFEPAPAIPATPFAASGGSFVETASGGEWTRPRARVTTGMAFTITAAPTTSVSQGLYEQRHGRLGSNAVLSTSVRGTDVRAASVIYPTPTGGTAPTITRLAINGVAALRVDDPVHDHYVLVVIRAPGGGKLTLPSARTGMPVSVSTDGATLLVVDVHGDGTAASVYEEHARHRVTISPTAP